MRKLLLGFILAYAPYAVFAADFYNIPNGSHARVDEHSVCKNVFNNSTSGLALFVPTKTDNEWTTFRNNLPSGVFLGDCGMLGSGGTLTVEGAYNVHTFTTSGTFTVSGANGYVEVLVVGGGSGGTVANVAAGGLGGGGNGGDRGAAGALAATDRMEPHPRKGLWAAAES